MRHLKALLLILFFCGNSSCEKDDICSESTPTTPKIVIDFLDIIDQETPKTVNNIRIRGLNPDSDVFAAYNGSDVQQVLLPLINSLPDVATTTEFEVYKDYERDDNGTPDDTSDDFDTGNPDKIIISYIIKEVYVSAACGFKSQYENVTITVENDSDNWILLTSPANDNLTIIDETTTHYNLIH